MLEVTWPVNGRAEIYMQGFRLWLIPLTTIQTGKLFLLTGQSYSELEEEPVESRDLEILVLWWCRKQTLNEERMEIER